MPVAAVLMFAFGNSGDIWEHLVRTSLFGYVKTTLWLMLGVGVSVFVTGVSTAWVVTMCRFPGRKVFEWLLLLPLAMPAYVIAYAYTDFLEFADPGGPESGSGAVNTDVSECSRDPRNSEASEPEGKFMYRYSSYRADRHIVQVEI